jgi:hypothetical protein
MFKAYYKTARKLIVRLERSSELLQVVGRAYKSQTEPRALTALHTFLYLTQIEIVGTAFLDMAILMLTAKGIDLHIEPDYEHRYTRHVTSLADLDSPSLTLNVKLDFLKMNGLSFFEKCIDRTLRNDIAHANFEIDENGKFFQFTKKGKREVHLFQKFVCFSIYEECIFKILREQTTRTTPSPK